MAWTIGKGCRDNSNMSRVYDALKRTEGLQSNVVFTALQESGAAPEAGAEPLAFPKDGPGHVELAEATLGLATAEYAPAVDNSAYRSVTLRLAAGGPVFPFDGTDAQTGEQYRMLRTRILQHPLHPGVIVVTSAGPGDGKTVTAVNLAGILALKSDTQVLLIDGDLRRRTLADTLGLDDGGPGLAAVLRGTCTLEDAILQVSELPKLHILPAGNTAVNPAELLDSGIWKSVVSVLRSRFRYIIIDSTPMSIVADFELVQACCDGVIVIVRPDHTDRTALMKNVSRLPKDKLLGVVINAVEDWPLSKVRSGYYYEPHPY